MILEFKPFKSGYTGNKEWPVNTEIPLEVIIFTEDLPLAFITGPWQPFLVSLYTKYAILAKVKIQDSSIHLTSLTKPPVTETIAGTTFKMKGLGGGIKMPDKDYMGRFFIK